MVYGKRICLAWPGLIILLLDDSESMKGVLHGTATAKYEWVARYGGIIFKELLARCTEFAGEEVIIKARYYVHVVLYGTGPVVWGQEEMDIESAVQRFTADGKSLGLGGFLGSTDASGGFRKVLDYLRRAMQQERFQSAFPPIVFHLTDGLSDTDATAVVEEIKSLGTEDGNVLVVNALIGTDTSLNYAGPEDFPGYVTEVEAGPTVDNTRMFDMSSAMPACIHANLVDDGIFPSLRENARLFFDVRTKEMLKNVIQVVGSIGSRTDRTG